MDDNGFEKNLEVVNLPLIDFESEDDFLISSSFRDSFENFRLSVILENVNEHEGIEEGIEVFGTENSQEAEFAKDIQRQREKSLFSSGPMEPGRASDLRNSLAWDSAFFTNAGVLDPEELSVINEGFKTVEDHLFPGIQDLRERRYADSESTLDSDGFSIESVDVDLFEDIRASIQKSTSKKLDTSHRNRYQVNPIPGSKKHNINMHGSETSKKKTPAQMHLVQCTERIQESDLLSRKPTKIVGRMNPISAGQSRRTSSGAYRARSENSYTNAGSGQSLMVSNNYGFGESYGLTSNSTKSPKSASLVSLSYDTSGSASSSKSSSKSLRRKKEPRNTELAVSVSTSKTPLRYSVKSKIGLQNPSFSTCSLPISNISSSISPASSFDGWSSESSISTSILNQTSDLPSHQQEPTSVHREVQKTRPRNQFPGQALRVISPLSAESTKNSRPSRLRMPSPKIGFFDEEKSVLPLVRGSLQFHLGVERALPSSDRATNRKRPGEFQLSRTLPEAKNAKLGSLSDLGIKARRKVPCLDTEISSKKVFGPLGITSNLLAVASKTQASISPEVGKEKYSKTRKIGVGEHDTRKAHLHSSLTEEGKGSEGKAKRKIERENKGHASLRGTKVNPVKDEPNNHSEDTKPYKKELGNDVHILCKRGKENLSNVEDQVNDLNKYFEVIDLNKDIVMELKRKRSPLGERNFLSKRSGSFGLSMDESTKEKNKKFQNSLSMRHQ